MIWSRTPRGQAFLATLNPRLAMYRKQADANMKGRDVYVEMRTIVAEMLRETFPNFVFEDAEITVTPILMDDGYEYFDLRFPVGIQHAFQLSSSTRSPSTATR
jgi:hypothetical protein